MIEKIIKILNECLDEELWNNYYMNQFIKEDRVLLNTEQSLRIYELSYLKHLITNSPNEDPIQIIDRKIKANYENRYCSALLKGLKEYITK